MSENPAGKESKPNVFYFQIILKNITQKDALQTSDSDLSFTISKGRQVFETTKPLTPEWNQDKTALLNSVRLNFVVLNYNPQKYQEFALRICRPDVNQESHAGEYLIDCNNFIEHFLNNLSRAFSQTMNLGDKFVVESQFYVERHRMELQKIVREVHHPKKGQKIQLIKIQQRPSEIRQKSKLATKQNRFKRSPSPTRKQIKEIIARRSPGRRQASSSRKKFASSEKRIAEKKQEKTIQKVEKKEEKAIQKLEAQQEKNCEPVQQEPIKIQQHTVFLQEQVGQIPILQDQKQTPKPPLDKNEDVPTQQLEIVEQTPVLPQQNAEKKEQITPSKQKPIQIIENEDGIPKIESKNEEPEKKPEKGQQQLKENMNPEDKPEEQGGSISLNPKLIIVALLFFAVLIFSFWPSSTTTPQKQKPVKIKKPSKAGKQKKQKKSQ